MNPRPTHPILLDDRDRALLERLAETAAATVVPAASYTVTLRLDDRPVTAITDDVRAFALEELQRVAAVGPGLECLRTGSMVSVPDLAVEVRWPEYRDAARRYGLRSLLSLPMTRGPETVGALNLYGFDHADTFSSQSEAVCTAIADQAALAFEVLNWNAEATAIMRRAEQQLAQRAAINQAVGIVMVQRRCDDTEALAWLRDQAELSRRPLAEVAADLVVATSRPRSGQPPVITGR
ncbi:MAG TPA: GAF and ANTAR domain-containing protein [Propionibacteriaceae bacterium]|nr:GAF and ANTAR domain-containing protein [Propionibacteriaceae bacterium]